MVSTLKTAKEFYKLQNEGKIARGLNTSKKLRLDSKGFYLNKKTSNGNTYMQRVKSTDKVYSRSEGVTMYSPKRDTEIVDVSHKKEGTKIHNKYAHMRDRTSFTGKNYKR